jgi:hypothetical protein
MSHRRSPRAPFIPRLEPLEDRCLLAVTVTAEAGGRLVIRGGPGSNRIRIIDNGTTGVDNVTVVANRRTFLPGIAVTGIVVRERGAGNDTVTYNLNGPLLTGTSRSVFVDLGSGVNAFAAKVRAGLLPRSNLSLQVNGGPNPDNISVSATSGIGIATGASLNLQLSGDGGDDTISTNYRGQLVGSINSFIEGGDGNDLLQNQVTLNAGSLGSYSAQVFGNTGDDTLTMGVRKLVLGDRATTTTILNGGPGNNTAVASLGVRLIRIQHHTMF